MDGVTESNQINDDININPFSGKKTKEMSDMDQLNDGIKLSQRVVKKIYSIKRDELKSLRVKKTTLIFK